MENEVKIFKQVNDQTFKYGDVELLVKAYADGSIEFNAEQAAIGFGLFEVKNGKKYVIWKRVNKYLSTEVSKGDFITEPQFYKLAIKANNQVANKFQDWVTNEVLSSIRKHGAYMTDEKIEEALLNPDTIIKIATELKKEREGRMLAEHQNVVNRPKVIFADAVSVSETSILVGQLAKILRQNGVNIGRNRLFAWMRDNGYLGKWGDGYNMPTQRSMELGLMEIEERAVNNPDGSVRLASTTKITGKGQKYFVNKFLYGRGNSNGCAKRDSNRVYNRYDR